jgi:hypothetical protein
MATTTTASPEGSFIPLSVFVRVFDDWVSASRVLRNLDFVGLSNFLVCYRHLFSNSLYHGESTTPSLHMGPYQLDRKRLQFRRDNISLDHYLSLWHFSIHSLHLRGESHSFPTFDHPVTCYKKWSVFPSQAKALFNSCAFFPPEAPGSLANALMVADRFYAIRIFRQGLDAYHLLREVPLKNVCNSIVISPLGTTVLLLGVCGEVDLLLANADGTTLTHLHTRITFEPQPSSLSRLSESMFCDENSFTLYDKNWDVWKYSLDRRDLTFSKEALFHPEVSMTVSYHEMWGKYWGPPKTSVGCKTKFSPLFSFAFSPAGEDGSCSFLVMVDRCGVNHEGWHRLQIVLSPTPGGGGQVYYLTTPNFYMADYVLHPDRRRIYVVGLTSLSQNMFYYFEPQATLQRPDVKCEARGDGMGRDGDFLHDSLGVYEIDLRGYSGLPESPPMLRASARFYAPSCPRKLAEAELLKTPSKERSFARRFGLFQWRMYRATCNRTFLVVRQEETHLLLFPHAASYHTPPFSVGFFRRSNIFASTAEMRYLVSLPSLFYGESPSPLCLNKMCTSDCAAPTVEDTNEYRRLSFVGPPSLSIVKSLFF